MRRGRGAEAGRDREAGPFCGSVPSATALFSSGGPGSDRSVRTKPPVPVPPRLARGAASALGTPAAVRGLGPPPPPRQGARETRRPTRPDPSRPGAAVGGRPPPHLGDGARAHVASLTPQAPAVPDEPPPPPEPALAHPGNTAPARRARFAALPPPAFPCTVGQPSASAHLLCADGRVNRLSHPRPENGTTPPAQGAGRKEKLGGVRGGRDLPPGGAAMAACSFRRSIASQVQRSLPQLAWRRSAP